MEDEVLNKIKEIAGKYRCKRVILFGSRARGDHSLVSDYDIAIFDHGLSDMEKTYIFHELEEIETLKKIDIVFLNEEFKDSLLESIKREGVVIYEQNEFQIS